MRHCHIEVQRHTHTEAGASLVRSMTPWYFMCFSVIHSTRGTVCRTYDIAVVLGCTGQRLNRKAAASSPLLTQRLQISCFPVNSTRRESVRLIEGTPQPRSLGQMYLTSEGSAEHEIA